MKLICLLLCLTTSFAFADQTHAQSVKLSLNLSDVSVSQALEAIEKEASFHFFYNNTLIDMNRKVSVKAENKDVFTVLDMIFKGSDVRYKVVDQDIILTITKETGFFQTSVITGTVTDANGDPMPGVNVVVKGTSTGVVSNFDGKYTISVPDQNAVLVFSFIGFVTQEFAVGNQTTVNVSLAEDTQEIEEVVVIGYGTVRKKDLTGSVSSVKTEELKKLPIASLDQGIQGRAAGVQVTTASGVPGSQVTIRIRGGNSLSSSNEPLYVVDGLPLSSGNMASGGLDMGSMGNNPMATINPNDIESIDILKDASSTAIYGSRGANGVVLITTKRGKAGKPKVTYDGSVGIQNVRRTLDLINAEEMATMTNVAFENKGRAAPYRSGDGDRWEDPSYYRDKSTDWQDLIYRTALMNNHQLGISGGNETTQYAVTGNYFGQEGTIINSGLQRGSLRANIDSKLGRWVSVSTSLAASRTFTNFINEGNIVHAATGIPATMPVYEDDGVTFTKMNQTPGGTIASNPYANALLIKDRATTDRVLANVNLKLDLGMLVKGLGIQTMFGTDYSDSNRGTYQPGTVYAGSTTGGLASKGWNMNTSLINENLLTYRTQIGAHGIDAVAGFSLEAIHSGSGSYKVQGIEDDVLEDNAMGDAASLTGGMPGSFRSKSTMASYFGRINYNFKDRYLLTATARADGSSKFGANEKWAFFPSVAVAWRVTEESFMESVNRVATIKLRASYGTAGNASFGNNMSQETLAGFYNYNFGGKKSPGYAPDKIANPFLQWETTTTTDVGLDMGFFNNRLNITADYYVKKTNDLLWNVVIPGTSGFDSMFKNTGTLENKGFELSVGYDLITGNGRSGAFTWSTTFMYSMNRNKVLEMPGWNPGRSGIIDSFTDGSWLEEGQPVGIWKNYIFDGVYQNQAMLDATIVNAKGETVAKYPKFSKDDGLGSPKFVDLNQDGVLNEKDRAFISNPQPKFIFSWNNNFTYKNFDLSIFINGSYGNDIINLAKSENASGCIVTSQRREVLNYWTPQNTDTDVPAPSTSVHDGMIHKSSWLVEDGSYLRLKNIVLGYRLPIKKGVESLRFYVSAQNLITITDYSGYDPEISSRGQDTLNPGVDSNSYPTARVFTFGVNLAF